MSRGRFLINTDMKLFELYEVTGGSIPNTDPYGAAGTSIDAKYNPEDFKYAQMQRDKYKSSGHTPVVTTAEKQPPAEQWQSKKKTNYENAGIRAQKEIYKRIGQPRKPVFYKN